MYYTAQNHKCKYICLFNPINAELNHIRHLLALVGARHIVHVSRVRVKQVPKTPDVKPGDINVFIIYDVVING